MGMSDHLCTALLLREGYFDKEQYKVVYDPANSAGSSMAYLTHVYKNGVLVEIITKK